MFLTRDLSRTLKKNEKNKQTDKVSYLEPLITKARGCFFKSVHNQNLHLIVFLKSHLNCLLQIIIIMFAITLCLFIYIYLYLCLYKQKYRSYYLLSRIGLTQ